MSTPSDADSLNARLLVQAGFIEREAAGIYNYLPLGLRVLHKINRIIREEMDAVGGQEILMPVLHPRERWIQSGRDKTMDEILYRTKGHGESEFVMGPSHEETVTPLAKKFIQSYKDLPFSVYQIQAKFRNEPRAKSGLLRGREFGMKDMYSFHANDADLDAYYEQVKDAYLKIYQRIGLEAYVVEASGGAFSDKFSHEFSIVTDAGEDKIFLCIHCKFAQNAEIVKDGMKKCPKCGGEIIEKKAIEAGNIFKLGTKYSKAFDLTYTDESGKSNLITMGCYGLGNTRLLGTIVEASNDEKGIIWPKAVAPYRIHLMHLGKEDDIRQAAEDVYGKMVANGVEVLYDDREESAGKKLNDADLIGIPLRVVISRKTLATNSAEVKERHFKDAVMVNLKKVPEL